MSRTFNRHFVLLWQGQLVSQLGNQAYLIAATYLMLDGTGSASLVALVMMASTVPLAIIGPIGGTVADRHSRRTILVTTDLARAVIIGSIGVYLLFAPVVTSFHVALLVCGAALSGIMGALFAPAAQAIVPDLVRGERLASANAVMQISSQTCMLVGQALGGVLYVTWGAAALLLFDAASFVYGGLSTWFIPADRRVVREANTSLRDVLAGYLRDTREGLMYVRGQHGMIALLATFAGVNVLFMPIFVLLPVYVRDVLGSGPEWYGFLLAGSGMGALVGSAVAGMLLPKARDMSRLLAFGVAGVSGSVLVIAATTHAWIALTAFMTIGALSSTINVTVITMFQAATPTAVRGRVMSLVIALSTAAAPLGMAAGGLIGDAWRESIPLVFAGCGIAIAALMMVGWHLSAFSRTQPLVQTEQV
jgi:MFS transporter, DHA3 family, macrolide efflux protein